MKLMSHLCIILFSNLFLVIRILCGKRISFNLISLVSPFASLKTKKGKIRIGRMCAIRSNAEVCASGGTILIGNNCFINRNCMIVAHDKIDIGDGTTIGPNVCIYDHDHNYKKDGQDKFISAPIFIGKNVWIGASAIILKGAFIGDNCVVGAGTLVKGAIDPNTVIYNDYRTITRKKSIASS